MNQQNVEQKTAITHPPAASHHGTMDPQSPVLRGLSHTYSQPAGLLKKPLLLYRLRRGSCCLQKGRRTTARLFVHLCINFKSFFLLWMIMKIYSRSLHQEAGNYFPIHISSKGTPLIWGTPSSSNFSKVSQDIPKERDFKCGPQQKLEKGPQFPKLFWKNVKRRTDCL